MKHWIRTSLSTTALLTAIVGSALAQTGPGPAQSPMTAASGPKAGMHEHKHEHQRGKMAERHAKHLNKLKTQLKLDAQQEGAWNTFAEAMQPPATGAAWPDRAALAKMSTPERVDQMQAFHAQRQGMMHKRGEASKTFYASLNAEQKKIFDQETARFMSAGPGHRMHQGH
ncbi:MAG: hypothetical protein FJY36_00920 [Betaproteobacteria bacterium]|nr:hypothetical protein [Betaproteobacteria bacterium]